MGSKLSSGIFIAEYNHDLDDGSWLVWNHPYHYGIHLTEEEAKQRAAELNKKYYKEQESFERFMNE